jgi:Protein of unknown function (DUF3617)
MRLVPIKAAVVAVSWGFVVLAVGVSAARADGIAPGLWRVITQSKAEGMVSAPHESAKCLTEDETKDLATTFSPVPRMINSECAPLERKLEGGKLDWHLVCKGQLNVELTGAFNFDNEHHYTATVRTHAQIGNQTMDTLDMLEGRWVSACQ